MNQELLNKLATEEVGKKDSQFIFITDQNIQTIAVFVGSEYFESAMDVCEKLTIPAQVEDKTGIVYQNKAMLEYLRDQLE